MNFENLNNHCRQLAFEGKTYEEIIQSPILENLSDAERNKAHSLIDDYIVQYQLIRQIKVKQRTQLMLATIVVLMGFFLLITTWLRDESGYTIGAATLLTGFYFLIKSYKKYKQPIGFQEVSPRKESMFNRY